MFVGVYPELDALNVMGLSTPQSAILSAVIFNALIIVALIPLALRGVGFRPGAGERAAPSQPARLRPRRDHRPVHRHQADRPRRSRHSTSHEDRPMTTFVSPPALAGRRPAARADAHHRRRLPGRRHGRRAGRVPVPGEWLVHHDRRRPDDRLEPHRPGASARTEYFWGRPSAAGRRLRRQRLAGSNLGPTQPGAHRPRSPPRSIACGRPTATRPSPSTS